MHSAEQHSAGSHAAGSHSAGSHAVGSHSAGSHSAERHAEGPDTAAQHSAAQVAADQHAADQHAAEQIEAALLAHPSVARLAGTFASYLPGKRVVGVRAEERVGVSVVLHTSDRPIPEVVAELRTVVARVTGNVPVDVVVADLEEP
ncbi:hypothetical protein AB0I60_04565 [Actinosynnema sp. NPDC050436]|uniref:hypothetical protein n=1 Tax=Actinosynnema sp. NPDC050436 TaxID=3155659 RepID=UPI0034115208